MMMKSLKNSFTSCALSAFLASAASAQDYEYDIDCAIILCMAGGWTVAAKECTEAFEVMIKRIIPWPVEPPVQACTYSLPGIGLTQADYSRPEFEFVRNARIIELTEHIAYEEGDNDHYWLGRAYDFGYQNPTPIRLAMNESGRASNDNPRFNTKILIGDIMGEDYTGPTPIEAPPTAGRKKAKRFAYLHQDMENNWILTDWVGN